MRLTDEQIGAGLRALSPTPDQSFAATLDARVTAGFPAVRRKAKDRELTWGRLMPILAGLAAVAVVAVVISNTGNGGGTNNGAPAVQTGPVEVSGTAAQRNRDLQQVAGGGAASTLPAQPPTAARPHNGQPQVQELSASLGLVTDPGNLQDAADSVVQVTNRYDGFVDSSSVHVTGGSDGHAAFSLRIPAAHLHDALTDLSALGRVTSRDEGSTNVTGAYTDAGKSYRDAQANVATLLDDLRNASSPAEASAIRQQLVVARAQLAASRSALRGIKQRVVYAPVSVEIAADGNSAWSIGSAADDAVNVLEAIAGAGLIALAVLVPLAALFALGWLGARELRRRRREATLDA
jgi:hypothetical protein